MGWWAIEGIHTKDCTTDTLPFLDPIALEINRYTPEAWQNAPTFADEAQTIADLLCGNVVVGHNIQFDMGFIEKQLKACNVKYTEIPHR